MTDLPTPSAPNDSDFDAAPLILTLRRKQGTWVSWGQACQTLQKAGYSPQTIFEETGFEPIQQNQVMVAAQVYVGLVQGNADPAVLEHFEQRGSDLLYALRILTQSERIAVAAFLLQHGLDADETHDAVKSIKDFSRIPKPPEAFTAHPGDAVAHQCWLQARQKSDLQARSRLIAKGLRFAHSLSARQALEKLLTDFSVINAKSAPLLPMYRLESDVELPRILPLVGQLPLPAAALKAVPVISEEGPFRVVQFAGEGAWVPLPGWQVLLAAEDPIALLSHSDRLPIDASQGPEIVLVVVDRAQRDWDDRSHFILESEQQLVVQYCPTPPDATILGKVLLAVRPKRILDETVTKELWLIDE